LQEVLESIAARVDASKHPLLAPRDEERNVVVVVVTADKGLAGAFNANAIKAAMNLIRERQWQNVQILPLGRKGNDFFKRRTLTVRKHATHVLQALSLETAHEISTSLANEYVSGEIDAVYVVYNEFRSIISQVVHVERLLPIQREEEREQTDSVEYLFEPSPEEILNELLPRHIEFQLYRILLESAAAEQGARMTAMEAATKNASDMIDHLTLTYNRIRQAAITKEIIEIVSGAAAQK
ncbi:MAG TPA: ATP synthase F1 subunit gamma, partial [Thermoanaerobaculia bacterium]|nr:ATP synthase F1 subunit gamma [Thermoanaerobaculia bacterium]